MNYSNESGVIKILSAAAETPGLTPGLRSEVSAEQDEDGGQVLIKTPINQNLHPEEKKKKLETGS